METAAVALPGVLDPADARPAARTALHRWLALHERLAFAPREAAERLRETGDPRGALRSPRAGPGAGLAPARREEIVAALRRVGAVAVPLLSRSYPCRLSNLPDPPPLLFVRGEVAALAARSVAIVGSRAATVYGTNVARGLARDLARAGLVVVSGLARGIDAAAHRGALEAGGRTVAVLPCGPDRVYPRRHRALAEEIVARGAVVSELPVGSDPRRSFFAWRNRLITGLADGLVVVEARERSGSLVSAGHAANQGIDVFAVPGPISSPTSAGPNRLLREGACVTLSAADVLEVLALGEPVRRAAEAEAPPPAHRVILDVLAARPLSRDELARRLGLAPEALAPDLLELELEGRIAEDRDGALRTLD